MISRIKSLFRGAFDGLEMDRRLAEAAQHSAHAAGHSQMNTFLIGDFADRCLLLQGRMAANAQPRDRKIRNLSEVEFRVYSQWGEDGIIEWLCAHVPLPDTRFVEFGVENFREANCRFLMHNRNWKGLVMDGDEKNIAHLQQQALYWMHDLTAKGAFVSSENINSLLEDAGFVGSVGILSIDVDGNDYWIWKSIDVIDPAIVICEYNAILGDQRRIVVPYDANFARLSAHHSGLYFGASIGALKQLASDKGYVFVGTNSNGVNAFFVRDDLAKYALPLLSEQRAFPSRHRDSRDENGQLTFRGGLERLKLIQDRLVIDVDTGETIPLSSLQKPYSDEWLAAIA